METEPGKQSSAKTIQFKCPCQENKNHLGVSILKARQSEVSKKLLKVQRKFFLGQGLQANIFF